jgi:hypothetical protein
MDVNPALIAALSTESDRVRENAVNKSSRDQYSASISKFLTWLYYNKNDELTREFVTLAQSKLQPNQQVDPKVIKKCFAHPDVLPLDF